MELIQEKYRLEGKVEDLVVALRSKGYEVAEDYQGLRFLREEAPRNIGGIAFAGKIVRVKISKTTEDLRDFIKGYSK